MNYPLTTPLSDALGAAVAAGACAAEMRVLRSLAKPGLTLADLLSHPRAAYWAFWYARDVINGRWPEAEATIASDPAWAFLYARNVSGVPADWRESIR